MSAMNTVIQEDGFGVVASIDQKSNNGNKYEIVKRFTLTNKNRASVRLISYGARIQSIRVPNKNGIIGDVLLGYDDMKGYSKNRYVGGIIGRVANEITNGAMIVNSRVYKLSLNDKNGLHHWNGGFVAFDNVNWDSYVLDKQVVMSHLSYNGNEGYPGFMLTQVKYSWTDDNELHINICATSTKSTPVNISNYCLFNLAGHGMGSKELKRHVVTVNSDRWIHRSCINNISIESIRPVESTVFDLRSPTQFHKKRLAQVPKGGYDHIFCISSPNRWCYRFHARILHPDTGRFLEIYSNHPALQIYTCNDPPGNLDDDQETEVFGKNGVRYGRHSAFLLSPQNYPNAVNIEHFPPCILHPGQVYIHDITYKFGLI